MRVAALRVGLVLLCLVLAGCAGRRAPAAADDGTETSSPEFPCEQAASFQQSRDPKPVDLRDAADVNGPLSKQWRWKVENASFQKYEVTLRLSGPQNTSYYTWVGYGGSLAGGLCDRKPQPLGMGGVVNSFAVLAQPIDIVRYTGKDAQDLGDWTLTVSADHADLHYDLRVRVEY